MANLKVRVRAATGGPTLKVQVPPPCSLQALKDVIASQIGQPTSSFQISLNKKAPIDGPPNVLLSAFGIINGDLLFYIPTARDSVHLSTVSSMIFTLLLVSHLHSALRSNCSLRFVLWNFEVVGRLDNHLFLKIILNSIRMQ